jgi:hypothetical protein
MAPEAPIERQEAADAVRAALKTQYHAALRMLRQAIEACPDALWSSDAFVTKSWQLAYHTLFFAHLYLQPEEAAFVPWEGHQADVQAPDGIAGDPVPDSPLPLLPRPYTKEEVLAYCRFCRESVDGTVDGLDVLSPESGFHWYPISKLAHQIVNIRHIQHGAAQLADRVRAAANFGVDWVGAANAPGRGDRPDPGDR